MELHRFAIGDRDLIIVVTAPDQTDGDLVAQARAVMEFDRAHPCDAAATVHGYDDDPRELWDIPGVRAHLRRLVDFGLVALLVRSIGLPALGAPAHLAGCPGFGAFEVWAHGHGLLRPGDNAVPEALVQTFAGTIWPAAGESLRENLERYAHVPADRRLLRELHS